jgi:hypothetical protein
MIELMVSLLKLGIEVAQLTVGKYMAKSGRGRSQTWKTFLRNHPAGIAAMDFLVVPPVGLKLLFVLVWRSAKWQDEQICRFQ